MISIEIEFLPVIINQPRATLGHPVDGPRSCTGKSVMCMSVGWGKARDTTINQIEREPFPIFINSIVMKVGVPRMGIN